MINLTAYGFRVVARAPQIIPVTVDSEAFIAKLNEAAIKAWVKVFGIKGRTVDNVKRLDSTEAAAHAKSKDNMNGFFEPSLFLDVVPAGDGYKLITEIDVWSAWSDPIISKSFRAEEVLTSINSIAAPCLRSVEKAAKETVAFLKPRHQEIVDNIKRQIDMGRTFKNAQKREDAKVSLKSLESLMKFGA